MNQTLLRKLTRLVILPLTFEVIFVGALAGLLVLADQDGRKVDQAKEVQGLCREVMTQIYQLTISAFMTAGRHDEISDAAFDATQKTLPAKLRQLHQSCKSNKTLTESSESVVVLSHRLVNTLSDIRQSNLTIANFGDAFEKIDFLEYAIIEDLDKISAAQEKIASYRRIGIDWQSLLFGVLGGGLLLSFVVSWRTLQYAHTDILNRIKVMMDNTSRIAQRKELNALVAGSDEISQLDRFTHKMNADLIAAQRARQEFIGMLTHDMRTPLTNVNILLGMIAEGIYDDDAPKRRKLTAKMVPEIERISRLIEDLLSLEKLDEGKLDFSKEPCNVKQLLESARDAVQNQANASNKAVATDMQNDFSIVADSFQITRVLINLTANALKYTDSNSTVIIRANRTEDQVLFEVIDEGPGVNAETIPRLFERFGQGEDRLARTGFGLGLAICKAIVEAHNGSIGAHNREDRSGAVFFFTLPMA